MEHVIRLNIPFDLNDEDERRFAELFESVPNGFKVHLVKKLLMDSTPKSEDELDLMLARLIRQRKASPRGRSRGRAKREGGKAVREEQVAPAKPAASGGEAKARESETPPQTGTSLAGFEALAGGQKW